VINIDFNGRDLILFCTDSFSFSPSQLHQLAFWGFRSSDSNLSLKVYLNKPEVLLSKLIKYFQKKNLEYTILDKAQSLLIRFLSMRQDLEDCANLAARVKDGDIPKALLEQVSDLNNKRISRPLKDHQLKSLIHLLAARHGANFSVPGSGKTAVVLSAYKIFLETNVCNTLFVVGPLACFTPWENEFSGIFGRQARSIRCAGGDSALRHANYSGYNNNFPDLFLTSFQTLYRDCEQIKHFFKTSGAKVFFVIDEAHYIKQLDGAWANSAAILAPFAVRRCILTGTPFPKSLQDGFNLFDFLWPDTSPLSDELKSRITIHEKNGNSNEAITCLNSSVAPFFYRVKKKELGLSNQIFNSPTVIKMNKHEKEVYDLIYNRVRTLDLHKYAQNLDLLFNLRRGRIMRMRQAASYIPLLQTVIPDYDEDILHASSSLSSLIANYDLKEIPAKAQYLEVLISTLRKKGHKVLIWSSFVKTLQFLKGFFQSKGIKTDLIFGGTPVESDDDIDIVKTRDYIINDFKNPSGSLEVLIANPAACAESVSLHTGCSHAIYYDLSYNCAQYIQSLDRIHRVGGSEKKAAHYYFLQYENTIDQDILVNLQNKQNRMSAIIDQDYPILDLNLTNLQNDDELGAYERVFNL
jgi:SNF2 family DNA or RNA helicase